MVLFLICALVLTKTCEQLISLVGLSSGFGGGLDSASFDLSSTAAVAEVQNDLGPCTAAR